MMRHRKAAIATLTLVPLLAGGFLLQERSTRDGARLLDQVMLLVGDRYVDTLAANQLYEKAAQGLIAQLNDPYSDLLTPKEMQGFTRNTGGRYGGVGMLIEDQNGNIVISKVFPNTPAEQAGVLEGDRIVRVDTASTTGWKIQQVSDALIGTPGTRVKVTFHRPGVTEPVVVTFTRAIIHVPAVPYAILLGGQAGSKVGYVPLQQFNETAAEELHDAIARLEREGATGIVLDLRGNGGGILDQALEISNLFLKKGQPIVTVRGRGMPAQSYVTETQPLLPTTPLVVLTDEGSASASEIVAGALQDHDRALVMGTTSFGKGLVQTVFPLDGGYALKLTTAKWFTPSGRSIQKERKIVDGQFVEEPRDSVESDSARRARPAYKSASGRVVYGGGGITPDLLVNDDTLTTVEQAFVKAIAPKIQTVYVTLAEYAMELKPGVKPTGFTVRPEWREEFYRRLTKAGVVVDRREFDAARGYVDRMIEYRVARVAFGDSTAKRLTVRDDPQLVRAIDLLSRSRTQRDLFANAEQQSTQKAAALPR